MADVLCFGNLQFDVLCRPVDALPPPGALRMVERVDFALSGNGGNVAAALGRLGVSVDLAGYSGADAVGDAFRVTLAELGVGLGRLPRHPSAGTGTSVIAVAPSGERTVLYVNGANACFELDAVPDEWLDGVRVVSVGAVYVLPQFAPDAVAALFRRARRRGVVTVLNVCPVPERADLRSMGEVLAETDVFVLNLDEGRQLAGAQEPEAILRALEAQTRGAVLLTLGADGCCLRRGRRIEYVPAVPAEVVDTTGAGDAFVAGVIAGTLTGMALADAARLGCQVAAYAVTGPGAYGRIPPLGEILGGTAGA